VLASGFFFAARQHFMMMDLGLKNTKMRKQIEDLESERRRLVLAKEISLSPQEITRAAQTMGFRARVNTPPAAIAKDLTPQPEPYTTGLVPVQTTFRQPDKSKSLTNSEKSDKKLVTPILQQTVAKQTPVVAKQAAMNERPRVVGEADKRVAEAPNKQTSKFR